MRKLLLVLALFSTTAFADTWKLIVDSTDGTRLLVDADSVHIDKYVKDTKVNGARVYATMEMLSGNDEAVFTAVIDADDCLVQQGGALVNIYPDKSKTTYFWSMEGGKLYDAEGQWLCGYLQGTLEVYLKQQQQKELKKPAPKPKISM